MKFAVMGTGDFGGRYGGRLVHAGLDVTFIARGQRYDEIKRNGLHIQADSQGRSIDIDHVQVADSPPARRTVKMPFAIPTWSTPRFRNNCTPAFSAERRRHSTMVRDVLLTGNIRPSCSCFSFTPRS